LHFSSDALQHARFLFDDVPRFLLEAYTQFMTSTEELIERVKSLSVEDQVSVIRFIESLERKQVAFQTPFLQAAEDFITEHPELLRRLAQ